MSSITFARDAAITPINVAALFQLGEAALAASNPFGWKQYSTIGSTATTVTQPSFSDAALVADATVLTVGAIYQWGSTKAQLIAIDPTLDVVFFDRLVNVAAGDAVKPVTLIDAVVSGLTFNRTTGVLSGTPDTVLSRSDLLYEVVDADGQKAYSTTYDLVVMLPPVPPSFAGLLSSQTFDVFSDVDLDWTQGFILADTYTLNLPLPAGLTFQAGHVRGNVTGTGEFGPYIVTGRNGVLPNAVSNPVSLSIVPLPVLIAVPDVDDPGTTELTARQRIAAAQLFIEIIEEESVVQFGTVLRQSPLPDIRVSPGTTVRVWISSGLPAADPTEVQVLVTGPGYFADFPRLEGDVLTLTHPSQFSPYWMAFIDAPPESWLAGLEPFDADVDREIVKLVPELHNIPPYWTERLE